MKIKIKLHSASSQEKINKISDDEFEVWIKEKPVDEKANIFMEKYLKKYFNAKQVQLIKGTRSKNKIVEVK